MSERSKPHVNKFIDKLKEKRHHAMERALNDDAEEETKPD